MDYGTPSTIQSMIMAEASSRSGIKIIHNYIKFYLTYMHLGFKTNGIKGSYVREKLFNGDIINEQIFLNVEFSYYHATSVLFHELAHATGIHTRLNRVMPNALLGDIGTITSIEEATAEIAAMKLMQHFGLDSQESRNFSTGYIWKHTVNMPPHLLELVEDQAEEAKNYILDNWLSDLNISYKEAV